MSIARQRKAGMLKDAYTGEDIPANGTSDLDHVVSAKEIHDDRGRSLAGLKGTDLANSDENLQATNRLTNRTKKTDDMVDIYVFKSTFRRTKRTVSGLMYSCLESGWNICRGRKTVHTTILY